VTKVKVKQQNKHWLHRDRELLGCDAM